MSCFVMDDSGDIRLNDVIIGLGDDDRAPLNPEDAAILQQINKYFNIDIEDRDNSKRDV